MAAYEFYWGDRIKGFQEACKVALTVFESVEMNGTYIKVLKDSIPKAEAK